MSPNPVEENFVTRYALGFAIIAAMMLGGGAGGWALASLDVPGGRWIGTLLGALVVLVAVGVRYQGYDESYNDAE